MESIFRGVILRTNGDLYICELECKTREDAIARAEFLMHPTQDRAILGVMEQTLPEAEIPGLLRKCVAGFFSWRG